MKYEKVALQQA